MSSTLFGYSISGWDFFKLGVDYKVKAFIGVIFLFWEIWSYKYQLGVRVLVLEFFSASVCKAIKTSILAEKKFNW